MFTFTSTSTVGRDLFDRLVSRGLHHVTVAFNMSSTAIVNVLVLVTVNVNGMNPSRSDCPGLALEKGKINSLTFIRYYGILAM
jgi:hypothetical protein